MRKRFYTLVGALLLSSAFFAQGGGYKSVVVSMADGSTTDINLSEGMTTEFTDESVVFKSSQTLLELTKADVVSIKFSEELAGVNGIGNAGTQFAIEGNSISFKGLAANSRIDLFDLQGKCLSSNVASGDFSLPLGKLQTGIYIVKVNGISYKIVKP